jgi:hypothetical protein
LPMGRPFHNFHLVIISLVILLGNGFQCEGLLGNFQQPTQRNFFGSRPDMSCLPIVCIGQLCGRTYTNLRLHLCFGLFSAAR